MLQALADGPVARDEAHRVAVLDDDLEDYFDSEMVDIDAVDGDHYFVDLLVERMIGAQIDRTEHRSGCAAAVLPVEQAACARFGHYVRVKKSVAFDLGAFSGGTVPVTDRPNMARAVAGADWFSL